MFCTSCGHSPTNKINAAIWDKDTTKALELIETADLKDLDRNSHNGLETLFIQIFDTMEITGYPINVATEFGNFEVTKALVEKGVDINVQDSLGYTPLLNSLNAYTQDRYKMANYLLDNGADASITNDRGESAVDLAVLKDDMILTTDEIKQERINLLYRLGYTGENW